MPIFPGQALTLAVREPSSHTRALPRTLPPCCHMLPYDTCFESACRIPLLELLRCLLANPDLFPNRNLE